jgi:hypothetical protein
MDEMSTGLPRVRLRVTIAALISGVAVAIIGFWSWSRSPMPPDPPVLTSPLKACAVPIARFAEVIQGYGESKTDGVTFCSILYKTPDGIKVFTEHRWYPSKTAARRAAERMIQDARTVVERGSVCDKTGHRVGERAVLLLSRSVPSNQRVVLVSRVEKDVFTISSVTSNYVLEFSNESLSNTYGACESKQLN